MNGIKEIAEVLAKVNDEKLIVNFLKSILTKNELKEIELRWELVKLLDEGMSQRKISEKLGVSLCKITRGSRELKKKPSAFKEMIEKHRALVKKRA
ncbi:MAG: trp operon repressor [Spirochaetes bacterium]|nr:trp operon repressor [Spirochaetota bacterium]